MAEHLRITYFTASTFEEITEGATSNLYDLFLANLSGCGADIDILHLGPISARRWLPHPRLLGVKHIVPEVYRVTPWTLLRLICQGKKMVARSQLIYLPYVSLASVIAWFWSLTMPIVVYQRITWPPYLFAKSLKMRKKERLLSWVTETAAIHGSDRLGVGSSQLAEYVVKRGAKREKVSVTTNLVDCDGLPQKSNYQLSAPPTLVIVGRLTYQKRIEYLLEAVQELNLHLEIYGDGPERSKLEQIAQKYSVNVSFRGKVPNSQLRMLLAQADLYVSASIIEAVPKAMLEAMAVGLPIVACSAWGVDEWLDNERGLITEATVSGLREGIQQLLANGSLRQHLGSKAAIYARSFHNPEHVLAQDRAHVLAALATLGELRDQ